MHTYGGLPALLAVLGVLALAAALGLYYALAAACYWRWRAARLRWRLPLFAALWTLAELARHDLHRLPVGAIGYAQVDALAPLAPWVGVYGMGTVAAALALLAAQAWQLLRRRGRPGLPWTGSQRPCRCLARRPGAAVLAWRRTALDRSGAALDRAGRAAAGRAAARQHPAG